MNIDHRLITPGHPEANGLAERIVQVLKKALRKYVLIHGVAAWPEHLPTIEFGYRTSPQRSTRFSPYFLVYWRQPTYPAQIRAMLDGAQVDVTNDSAMFLLITHRAQILRDVMPLAHNNVKRYDFRESGAEMSRAEAPSFSSGRLCVCCSETY